MRNTAGQLQAIIVALEDTKFTNKAIYITYINFRNAFGSIDYTHLLAIMIDLIYLPDAIDLIGNIYSSSYTFFLGEHFTKTPPIPISHGTIQGDILSP